MKSVLFEIGPVPIHGYGLMILLGFFLSIWVAGREAKRRGLPDFVYDLGLIMLLTGLVGGRINHYIQYFDEKYAGKSLLEFFKIWEGGLVFYGGALAGFLGGWLYLRHKKLPLADCLDACAPAIPIAMATGRIGCFLHGCCYGKRCAVDSPLAVTFPARSPVHSDHWQDGLLAAAVDPPLAVHPVQLYQSGHDLLMFVILFVYMRRSDTPRGVGIPLLFVLYGVGRFFLEGLRGDHKHTWLGLTYSQRLSVVLVVVFGAILALIFARARRAEPRAA